MIKTITQIHIKTKYGCMTGELTNIVKALIYVLINQKHQTSTLIIVYTIVENLNKITNMIN